MISLLSKLRDINFRFLALLLIGIVSIYFQWFPAINGSLHRFENIVSDKLWQWVAYEKKEERIIIIDIDEKSIGEIGPWPWSREILSSLVEKILGDYQARHVGLDIVFPSAADIEGDVRLRGLSETRGVTLAQVLDFSERKEPLALGKPVWMNLSGLSINYKSAAMPATGYMSNHAGLMDAPCVGNIGVPADADGTLRRVPIFSIFDQKIAPILPLAMIFCDYEISRKNINFPENMLSEKPWKVRYLRTWDSYKVISAIDIIENKIDFDLMKDKWVLIGSSALGLNDRVATPLGETVAGVLIHAAVLSFFLDLLQDNQIYFYYNIPYILSTIFISVFIVLAYFIFKKKYAQILLPAALVWTFGWLYVCSFLMSYNYVIQVTPTLIAILGVIFLSPFEWWIAQRENFRTLKIFSNYVAPSVLKEMLVNGIDHPLTPRYTEITVLSADMQGYTALTNSLSLQDTALVTRQFLDCLTQPLLKTGGTLDKYVGDGLVGFWGAPIALKTPEDDAVEAGLEMLRQIRNLNRQRAEAGLQSIRVRIGIESGLALVGDLGTDFRSAYTAVGDCINISSKLQAAAKNIQYDLIIGEQAAARISRFNIVEIGVINLSGISNPMKIFTIKY